MPRPIRSRNLETPHNMRDISPPPLLDSPTQLTLPSVLLSESSETTSENSTSQLAPMLLSWERFVSTTPDSQSLSPIGSKHAMSIALSNTGDRSTELIPGRNAPSPRPTQRGARNDEEQKIRRESHSEPTGCRHGLYFHAHVPQPGIVYDHSPTGMINRSPDVTDHRVSSPPPANVLFSQRHAYDHAVIVSHHVTAEHRAQTLNESKALPRPPTRKQHQSAPNGTVPLHHGLKPRASKTEYNKLNPSLRILIGILGKMMTEDTPMHRIVNRTTMRHLVTILNLKECAQIPGQVSNNHNKANLLEFATYVLNKDLLRRTGLQDAGRKIRCLITGLGVAGMIIPDVLLVDCREVTQEREPFAFGPYANVFRGIYRDKRVAVRRLRSDGLSKNKCREVLLWSTLAHKNVVPFIGMYFASDGYLMTISLFMDNGTLLSWRLNSKPPASEIARCMREVAEGLQYLHNEGVIHGDVHGNNVLLDSNFRARLADLGLSLHSDALPPEVPISAISYHFTAPELFSFEDDAAIIRTEQTDTFAFACLYYQIHYGRLPFEGNNKFNIPWKVKQGTRARKLPDPPIDDRVWTLIMQCWQHEPAQRPTMYIVLNCMRSWQL